MTIHVSMRAFIYYGRLRHEAAKRDAMPGYLLLLHCAFDGAIRLLNGETIMSLQLNRQNATNKYKKLFTRRVIERDKPYLMTLIDK